MCDLNFCAGPTVHTMIYFGLEREHPTTWETETKGPVKKNRIAQLQNAKPPTYVRCAASGRMLA